jgi:hypothetical protein
MPQIFTTATIPELPDNPFPSLDALVEIHDPAASPASGRVPLRTLIDQITVKATRVEMKALPGTPYRKIVILTAPEPGVGRSYTYVHGDQTPPNDFSIIAGTDGLGTYFELLLS